MTWWQPYIGIPYKARGRSLSGCDCWGLVRLVYDLELEIVLPSLAEKYSSMDDRDGIVEAYATLLPYWEEIATPEPFSVAVCKPSGRLHCGVMVDSTKVLHAFRGADACVAPLRSWWREAKFYKPVCSR